MATFVLSYRNAKGYVPSPETRGAWFDWFHGMGDALLDMGQPVTSRQSVGTCDSDTTELGGYSLVDAADLDAAVAIAEKCPHLSHGGGVEVGELAEVQGDPRAD